MKRTSERALEFGRLAGIRAAMARGDHPPETGHLMLARGFLTIAQSYRPNVLHDSTRHTLLLDAIEELGAGVTPQNVESDTVTQLVADLRDEMRSVPMYGAALNARISDIASRARNLER